MSKFFIKSFLILLIINNHKDKPVITNVLQLSETSVSLKWDIQSKSSDPLLLTRYVIQISEDNFKFDAREWPGNIKFSIVLSIKLISLKK